MSLVDQEVRKLARDSTSGADKDICQQGDMNPHSAVYKGLTVITSPCISKSDYVETKESNSYFETFLGIIMALDKDYMNNSLSMFH